MSLLRFEMKAGTKNKLAFLGSFQEKPYINTRVPALINSGRLAVST